MKSRTAFPTIGTFLLLFSNLWNVAAELPSRVDNSDRMFCPPVARQDVDACSQFAGIHCIFTYEMNRARGVDGLRPENQYAPLFTWNFLNSAHNGGSEFFDGWQIAHEMGIPTLADWNVSKSARVGGWMTGYDRYYRAMQNRARSWELFPMTNATQLLEAKEWLFNGGNTNANAGHLLAVDYRVSRWDVEQLPAGSYEAGKYFVKSWSPTNFGHLMTCAGYDDQVGFDFNGDGQITNDRDIDGDGKVTLADWERGAFILVNSWGVEWGNRGRVYAPYRHHATTDWFRGRWMARLHVAAKSQPRLTLRVKFAADDRAALRMTVGTAERVDADRPARTWSPAIFSREPLAEPGVASGSPEAAYSVFLTPNRRLGAVPPLGPGHNEPVEMGFDLSHFDVTNTAVFFLEVGAQKGAALHGQLQEAAILRYDADGRKVAELPFVGLPADFGATSLVVRAGGPAK